MAGEIRHGAYDDPEAQASFVATRRGVMARRDIMAWVNHGAPSHWMQKSIRKAGLPISDFRSDEGGYSLQPGGSFSYGSVAHGAPRFMGILRGDETWREVEAKWGKWLAPDTQGECIDWLAQYFLALRCNTEHHSTNPQP